MKSQNVTIARKLYASFAFVVLMLLVITAFSFFVIGKLEEFRRDVRNITAAQDEIGLKRDLQLQAANVRQFMTEASLTKDKKVIVEKAKPALDNALKDIEKLKEFNSKNPEQLGKLEGLKKDLSGILDGEYDRISSKVLSDTAALADEQARNSRNDAKTISSKVGRVLHLISVMMIVLGVLGAFFAAFIMMIRNSVLKSQNNK